MPVSRNRNKHNISKRERARRSAQRAASLAAGGLLAIVLASGCSNNVAPAEYNIRKTPTSTLAPVAPVDEQGPVCYQVAEDDPLPAACRFDPGKRYDYHDGAWWAEGSAGYHPGR